MIVRWSPTLGSVPSAQSLLGILSLPLPLSRPFSLRINKLKTYIKKTEKEVQPGREADTEELSIELGRLSELLSGFQT